MLTPLEKYTYTVGDFIDRHGYFSCNHKGENAEWSIRVGHTFSHRSALKFDPEQPGKPKLFTHPVMDPTYDGKPSMISETTFTRPNRYRTEAPIFFAAYGALQGTDAIVHFAFDGADWSVKPNFFMQQWTLASPTMMGQFPAAALVFRDGYIPEGDIFHNVPLKVSDLFDLKGTPLPQDAALDELRLTDIPNQRRSDAAKSILDPLAHFVGQNHVSFITGGFRFDSNVPDKYIDHRNRAVTGLAGMLKLDFGKGLLTIDAPKVQGFVGDLSSKPAHKTSMLECSSSLVNGCFLLVSIDGKPLKETKQMLLQVMSEEKPTDFRAEDLGDGRRRIANIGRDPWLVREIDGKVRFLTKDAASLKITKLDVNGVKTGEAVTGPEITLDPTTIYYVVER